MQLKEAQEGASSCHVTMESLSKEVDSVRLECSKKLTENEAAHTDHSKALESNYMQLIETLNTKLKVLWMISKCVDQEIHCMSKGGATVLMCIAGFKMPKYIHLFFQFRVTETSWNTKFALHIVCIVCWQVSELNVKKTNDNIRGLYEENEGLKETVSSLEEDMLTCEHRMF